jgi:hypothetical protein
MTKTAGLSLRISPETREAIAKAAAEDRRTVSSMTEVLLIEALTARGYLKKPKRPGA